MRCSSDRPASGNGAEACATAPVLWEETKMNYNERTFNMNIASVCGLREAVIADLIRELQLTSDETTCRHGKYWAKCSQKMMTVSLPFLSEDMIQRSVRKLVDNGIIKVGVFSDDKFDHTYWYTFTAYGEKLLDDGPGLI